jgi:hypothetical protein
MALIGTYNGDADVDNVVELTLVIIMLKYVNDKYVKVI